MRKKIELKVGDIWAVLPIEKTLEVRQITDVAGYEVWYTKPFSSPFFGYYEKDFRSWITCKKAVLIEHRV